jgi:thiamine biosynthesis lipoprotein
MAKKAIYFIVALILVSSCATSKDLARNTFTIGGTYLTIVSPDKRAAEIVFNEFSHLNKLFNLYNTDSELSRLNHTFNVPVKVSAEMIELLSLSAQVNMMTNGAFDVSDGALTERWEKFAQAKNSALLPSLAEVTALRQKCGMQYLAIDKNASTVTITKEGLKIDLGGIAQGYMVDKAVAKLKTAGINNAFIDAGGNIFCMGTNHGRRWNVGIKNLRLLDAIISQELIQDEAVATAGGSEQFFTINGQKYSHIIDPKTGFPVDNNVVSVTIITKNCVTAAGFNKPFVVMGETGIRAFLTQNPSTMRIFLLMKENGKPRMSIFR